MSKFFRQFYYKVWWALPLVGLSIVTSAQNTGTISPVIKIAIQSRILNEDRIISIYKPAEIKEFPGSVSPVIYLLDGELISDMVRSQAGYFCEIWRELPPITVVGIENNSDKSNRTRDLTFARSANGSGGGAENFTRFLNEELMPLIEKDYRKKPYRILMGSSLAGYFTVHTFLNHSELFDAYLASSPSLARNNHEIMKDLGKKVNETEKSKKILFLAVGNEGPGYVANAMKLDSLLKKNEEPDFRHRFVMYPGETHGTTPMKSYYDGFKFIFRVGNEDLGIPKQAVTYSLIHNYYNERSFIFGIPMKPNEFIINNYGYYFLYESKQIDKALEFFRMNVVNYPHSSNVYDSYGEGLLAKGDKENALMNYEKSLKLDPSNSNAEKTIAQLKVELKK